MIKATRTKLKTWIMLGILGIGLIAIVITGFGTGGMGGLHGGAGGSDTLIQIGQERVTEAELTARFDSIYKQNARQDPNTDRVRFFQQNFDAMLNGVIADRSLVAFARSLGFVVPREMVDRAIVAIPAFQNVAGQFDENTFRAMLQQAGLTEGQLREEIELTQLVRMLASPVAGGNRLPEVVAREYANLLAEQRTGQFVAIPVAQLAQGMQPSDQEIAQFYQQNIGSFALPERRVIKFAQINRQTLGAAVAATDQEVAAYYQQHQAEYGPGETRNVLIFTTQDQAAAQQFAQRVQGGASFADAARAAGFTPEDITFQNQTRQQVAERSDANFANAVFQAQQGAIVGPQQTQTGFQVARVEGVNRTPARPLATVRGEIVSAIETRKLSEQLNALVERIENRIEEGQSLEQVAQAEHLTLETSPPVAANGAGQNFQFPAELAQIVSSAFQLTPEDRPELATLQADQRFALVKVANVIPSAAPPLAEIKEQVRQRLVQRNALQRGRQVADGIASRVNGGMPLQQAIAQAGVALPPPAPVTLRRYEISQRGQRVPPPYLMLFSIPQGRARVIPAPNAAGWVVVFHERRTPGNVQQAPNGDQLLRVTRQEISESGETELRLQFARAVQNAMGVTRNEEGIAAFRQRLTGGAQ